MNEQNPQPATNNQQPTTRFNCRHIFTDGHRCGSICLRGEPFCYYHHTTRKPAPRKTFGTHSSFDLPLPEDRSAIQLAIGTILQRIASNDLDSRRAGLLLYGLQIASLNLPKQKEAEEPEPVEDITNHPELGTLAPQTEIKEKKSSMALLLEELRQPAVLPKIQACEDPTPPRHRRVRKTQPQRSHRPKTASAFGRSARIGVLRLRCASPRMTGSVGELEGTVLGKVFPYPGVRRVD